MRKYLLLLALVPIVFISCTDKSNVSELNNDRERFVGVYSLSRSGYIETTYNREKYPREIIEDRNEGYFELKLDTLSKTKLLAFDCSEKFSVKKNDTISSLHQLCFLDGLSADVKDGCLYFETYYEYADFLKQTPIPTSFSKATLDGNILSWKGVCSYTNKEINQYIYCEFFYTAVKIQ